MMLSVKLLLLVTLVTQVMAGSRILMQDEKALLPGGTV